MSLSGSSASLSMIPFTPALCLVAASTWSLKPWMLSSNCSSRRGIFARLLQLPELRREQIAFTISLIISSGLCHSLRLYADAQCVRAVLHVERRHYGKALEAYQGMHETAKQLGEPGTLAHALMNVGVELERAGRTPEALDYLEQARDVSFDASKAWAALVHSYLSRAYAGAGDSLRFQRASETAQKLAVYLPEYEDDEEAVFYNMSGVLAERSSGYLEIGKQELTLAMRDEIMRQIRENHNTRLETWVYLDWARAYLMLHEVEKGVEAAREFFQRATRSRSNHAIQRAYDYLTTLEQTGYRDLQVVHDFREELTQRQNNDIHQEP